MALSRLAVGCCIGLLTVSFQSSHAFAETTPGETRTNVQETMADRVSVRFFAPETGGAARPRYVTERELAFEARIFAHTEGEDDEALDDRHYHSALDRRISEQILAEIPGDRAVPAAEVLRIAKELQVVLVARVGGEQVFSRIAKAEGITPAEIVGFMERRARAAIYVDRALAPLLNPTEAQLRDLHRLGRHPYKNAKFEDVRRELRWWMVDERLRLAELSFLQSARTRITTAIVVD